MRAANPSTSSGRMAQTTIWIMRPWPTSWTTVASPAPLSLSAVLIWWDRIPRRPAAAAQTRAATIITIGTGRSPRTDAIARARAAGNTCAASPSAMTPSHLRSLMRSGGAE